MKTVEHAVNKAALKHPIGSVSVVNSEEGSQRTAAVVTSAYGLWVDPAAMILGGGLTGAEVNHASP